MIKTKQSEFSSAEICRENHWQPGTKLVGDEGYGPTVIEITAVGYDKILAKPVSHNGKPCDRPYETTWGLEHRDWEAL